MDIVSEWWQKMEKDGMSLLLIIIIIEGPAG
jgi:hypothetical protein